MTSAWQLLYIWKSRGGRSSEPSLPAAADHASESSRDSNLRRNRHCRGHAGPSHHRDDPNPLPRAQPARIRARNLCHRASQSEHESIWLDQRTSDDLQSSSGNHGVSTSVPSRMRLMRNNPLPEAVIQARQRLVERLGNVSLAGIRESRRAGISWDESVENHGSSSNDLVDRGNTSLREWFDDNLQHVDFTLDDSKMEPPSVSWEALCAVHVEVFRTLEENAETRASLECCSICLESFYEGDGLIRLDCGHRFHSMCLQPWVQTCCCCPYCRANIC